LVGRAGFEPATN